MKLWIQDGQVAVHELARHIQIVSQSGSMEPPEAPQRERRTLRIRVEFRRESYAENAALVEAVRRALQTPATVLKWVDDSGPTYIERWVTVTGWHQPESENAWGTYTQSIVFECYHYEHRLRTKCLPIKLKAVSGSQEWDLGAVFKWQETLENEFFDDMRSARRRVTGALTVSGAFLADTAATLEGSRAALLSLRQQLMSALEAVSAVRLQYGNFDRVIRVRRFTCDVDQARNWIEWQLTASFTRLPDEGDYAWLEYEITERTVAAEGITFLGLRGRVAASARARAESALNQLISGPASVVPSGWVLLQRQVSERRVQHESREFLELGFEFEWRDATTLTCTLRRPGGPLRDLGIVERFSERYNAQLFDEMRSTRRRALGVVAAQGRILLPDSLTVAEKQALLKQRKAELDDDLARSRALEFAYGGTGGIFPARLVRIVEFDAQINRLQNQIEWSLQATYTRFPNESDYAVLEYSLSQRNSHEDGRKILVLSGRVAAPNVEAANERLNRLRQAVIPSGYVQTSSETSETVVSTESERGGGTDRGDGTEFIEMTFQEEWSKTDGDVVRWTLRVTDAESAREGRVRTSYSGSVTARGATASAALTAAEARARALGEGKHPILVGFQLTQTTQQATTGSVFATVDFQWDYERQGTRTWSELTAERTYEAFGDDTETVQGFIAAPSLAAAEAVYAQIKNLYTGKLLLNERRPVRSRHRLEGGGELFDRYAFSFTVALESSGPSRLSYTVRTVVDWANLTQTSTVSGRVYARTRALADAALASVLDSLALGQRSGVSERSEIVQVGPAAAGAGAVTQFVGLEFNETFTSRLVGVSGILECEVTEQVRFSGRRLVERPIPGGPSIFQDTGTTPGQRLVSGRVRATTEAACLNWARKCRQLLVSGDYEEAPTISVTHRFLPMTDGTPRGGGANVLVFETSFEFREHLPEHSFV